MGKMTRPQITLDRDVYSLALERTAEVLDRFDHVAVMFSGGKDSTATLQVALEVLRSDPVRWARHLPLRVVFYDEEAIPYETADYVERVAELPDVALEWYCLPVQHRNACSRRSPYWWPWAPEARDRWCRPLPDRALLTLDGFPIDPPEARLTMPDANGLLAPPQLGNVALLMGIRAQESLTRRRAVTRRAVDNYIVQISGGTSRGNVWKAYPIYDWTTEDVWTAPALKGWDYNHAYDRLEMAGIGRAMQRCSPAFGEEPLQKIHTYAECFPDVWARMVDRVPGVGAAYRYALTELYCYRDRPAKPDGVPWPEFLRGYMAKWEPIEAALIADRIRDTINRHYRKTSLPIAPTAPNPVSGVSWDFLLMLAMRGDFKQRKQAGGSLQTLDDGRTHPKHWHRYAAELSELLAAGRFGELAHPGRPPADPWQLVPDYAKEVPA